MPNQQYDCRYFVSYSGVKLPLKLVNEIQDSDRDNRNTFFCGFYDDQQRLMRCEKRVYGEIELLHIYSYDDNGVLRRVEISDMDGEINEMVFDEQGQSITTVD
jgi:hypothetical protein